MNFVRHLLDEVSQKFGNLDFPLFLRQFDVCKLARAVDRDKQIQLARLRANLCNINVKIDGVPAAYSILCRGMVYYFRLKSGAEMIVENFLLEWMS